jgi:AcrR family transcriptional regulator
MTARPRGRRPGNDSSRSAIVRAARREFAERGYERATIRSIATTANVDPATIYHFFDDKNDLLAAALEFPVSEEVIRSLIPTDGDVSVTALLAGILELWQEPEIAERLTALFRVAVTHPDAAAEVSALLRKSVLGPLIDGIASDDAELRAGLVGAQIAGLALLRLVIPFGPIAKASIGELVTAVSPTIDWYLTGELGEPHLDGMAEEA